MVPQDGCCDVGLKYRDVDQQQHAYPALVTDTGDVYGTNRAPLKSRDFEQQQQQQQHLQQQQQLCCVVNDTNCGYQTSAHVTSLAAGGCGADRTLYRSLDGGKLYECPAAAATTLVVDTGACRQCDTIKQAARYTAIDNTCAATD